MRSISTSWNAKNSKSPLDKQRIEKNRHFNTHIPLTGRTITDTANCFVFDAPKRNDITNRPTWKFFLLLSNPFRSIFRRTTLDRSQIEDSISKLCTGTLSVSHNDFYSFARLLFNYCFDFFSHCSVVSSAFVLLS